MSIRGLAAFAVMLAIIAAVVVGASIRRGAAVRGSREGIVSLSPALTSLLFDIGAGDRVKGVSDYSRLPEGIDRPVVGDAMRINRETILWLSPRAIVTQQASPNDVLTRLRRDDHIEVLTVRIDTLDDLRAAIRRLGTLAGATRGAEAALARVNTELDAARQKASGRITPSVMLTINRDPVCAVGTETFLDELIEIAGGRNACRMPGYVDLNEEQVKALAPQIILDIAVELRGASEWRLAQRRESWAKLANVPAVRAERVHLLTDPSLTIPGVHVGRTAMEFARRIHPEAFMSPATTRQEEIGN